MSLTSTSSTTSNGSDDLLASPCDDFAKTVKEFLDALSSAWPDDAAVKQYKLGFKMGYSDLVGDAKRDAGQALIEKYHEEMRPFYGMIRERDENFFYTVGSRVEMMQELNVAGKFQSSPTDTREVIWEYLDQLNSFSRSYMALKSVPKRIIDMASTVAKDFEGSVAPGEDADYSKLVTKVFEMAQNIQQNMSEEEMRDLVNVGPDMRDLATEMSSKMMEGMMGGGGAGELGNVLMRAMQGGGMDGMDTSE